MIFGLQLVWVLLRVTVLNWRHNVLAYAWDRPLDSHDARAMEFSSVSRILETVRRDSASLHWSWITVTYLHSVYYDPLQRALAS